MVILKRKDKPAEKKNCAMSPDDIQRLITERAFTFYQERGNRPGDATADWLKAERVVKKELGLAKY